MNVLFISCNSVGPRWIMATLKKNGHNAFGIFMGYEDELMGEKFVPFLPPINKDFLKTKRIDIVGLSVDSFNVDGAWRISERIKNDYPEIKIIWGGVHPTIEAQKCISYPGVDYVCIGEGEYPMLDLCVALQSDNKQDSDVNIRNIWAKKGK